MTPHSSAMEMALAEAEAAAARVEVPVGAVLADGAGNILAAAGNRVEADRDPTAHAEMLVLRHAAARLGTPRLTECDLYVTLEPCAMCAAAIGFARLRRLYFGAYDPKGGAVEHGPRLFEQPTTHHRPKIYGGIEERRAGDLLRGFFQTRRKEAMMPDALVLYDIDDKVSIITLNRPDKLNAISADLQRQLTEAFALADADRATSVVLLRAEGRSFCAGYDISAKDPGADDWRSDAAKADEHLRPQLEFEMIPWTMKKPIIASVQGHVMGGGCELVMLCDLTIAADNATFGEPEVRFSSVGPALVMPMIIGYKKARELLYFGDTIDARTALDLGMVNRVVPLPELREASLRYAKRLSLISPEALYATKRAVNRGADAAGFRTALYAGLDVVGPLYATKTEFGQKFRDIVATEGVPAAVRWRSAQFKE
jgi:enoyl-CoA hydratase/carnithine racemase/tRNA(Arg) A34 adenosine deaminase TadA